MKRIRSIIILFIVLFLISFEALAKDTVYSLNKYTKESLDTIIKGYKENNRQEGFITAGIVLNKEKKNQTIMIKYSNSGEIIWIYTHPATDEEDLIAITYTYQNNKIDGYLLLLRKGEKTILLKVDLKGILCWEKELDSHYQKIITIKNDNNEPTNYLLIGNQEQTAIIDTYNLDLDRIDRKEYPKEDSESTFYDIAEVQNNQFAIIFNKQQKEETTKELWLVKLETNEITELDNSLNKYLNSQVLSLEDGFILYGITNEVKLKKGKASYYIIKYNKEGTIEWESIGNIPINIKGPIKIKNQKNQFFVLYENEDNSKEVIVLNQDGTYSQKIKKISNNYYSFNNFYVKGKNLYFVGEIHCAAEDDCKNDTSSLFLVSDEDKVIEVEDNTSTGILIGISLFIILIIGFIIKKRSQR